MPRSSPNHPSSSKKSVPTLVRHTPPAHPPTFSTAPAASFGQIVKEGIGFGAGNAIAQRAVSAIFGPPTITTISSTLPPGTPSESIHCNSERIAFETCLRTKSADDMCNNEILTYKHCLELK